MEKEKLKAGIVVDDWKLPIFRKALKKAGHEFSEKKLIDKATSLVVYSDNPLQLQHVLEVADLDCKKIKDAFNSV